MSEVASSVGGDAPSGPPPVAGSAGSGTEPVAAQLISRVLAASDDNDPVRLQAQLDLANSLLGLAGCIDEIVMPAMRLVRERAGTGQREACRVLAIEAVRTWLNHRGLFAPPPAPIGPILLACGPRDRDVVGLESLALLLRFHRLPCRVLGARVSTFTLTIAARAAGAVGVVVMSTEEQARPLAVASLLSVHSLGIPVFFAGDTFASERGRSQVPGRYLGPGVAAACAALVDTLPPAGEPAFAQRRDP